MGDPAMETSLVRPTRLPYRVVYALLFGCVLLFIIILLPGRLHCCPNSPQSMSTSPVLLLQETGSTALYAYNATYPLTSPRYTSEGVEYRIGLVADRDERSRMGESYTWSSYLRTGVLVARSDGSVSVRLDQTTELSSHLSEKGRGTELSELIVFNGKLYTVDDRSGIVFEVRGSHLIPWVILEDGPGNVDKGFKAEWMAVKDHLLYVGGLGKVWTSQSGEYVNDHPQWVKVITAQGVVHHLPWSRVYNDMKHSAGIAGEGYIIHESACWSPVHKKWYFLPRRASQDRYNDVDDEQRATNLMITADADLSNIATSHIGPLNKLHGFSSFKFLPGSHDSVIVAVKSEENKGSIASYILAFDLSGKILMAEQKIADFKLEGIEFI